MQLSTDTNNLTTLELAQVLMDRLGISPNDWHRLKSNRKARASEQAAAALVFLLKDQPEEAIPRLEQATGWLNRSISAPPCPTHGDQGVKSEGVKSEGVKSEGVKSEGVKSEGVKGSYKHLSA